MGRSKMSSLKITLLPLAICLLLSLNSQVSGKPSPKHLLIETKEKAKRTSDYDINANSFVNHGHVVSNDYDVNSRVLNNNGGTINSKDYTFPRSMIRRWNRGVITGRDYNINAGSFDNHGHIVSNGGK